MDFISQLPQEIQTALAGYDEAFKESMALSYLRSDSTGQADILAFIQSNGFEKARQMSLRDYDGTPTANDLKKLL